VLSVATRIYTPFIEKRGGEKEERWRETRGKREGEERGREVKRGKKGVK
jgi:hypothetical protein